MRTCTTLFFTLFCGFAFSQENSSQDQRFRLITFSPLDSIPEYLSSVRYTILEADRNLRAITTVSKKRYIALDTVVIRWAKINSSIDYKGSLKDIYDNELLTFDATSNAIMLIPSMFPTSSNIHYLHIKRSIGKQFSWGHSFLFEKLSPAKRSKVKSIISKMDVNQKVEYFLKNDLVIDALTTIELELLKRNDSALVTKYWEIIVYFLE